MQAKDDNSTAVQIMDKEFLINCPEESRAELINSARLLDQRMREIKSSGRVYGMERIAVMAALNLSHELLQTKQQIDQLGPSVAKLEKRIQDTLTSNKDK